MQEIYQLIDRQFVKADIRVEFHEHEHFEVFGLKNEFKQVCLNLLNNAKEVLIEKNIHKGFIEVKYAKTPTHGRIIISDNGGGISEDLLPDRLFEMNTTTKDNGTGIGLYICKTIVEEHMGGTITVKNTDVGAEFTITLPLNNGINS